MRYADGTLTDLTLALNEAIDELSAPISHADGTLASATSQLNELLIWYGSPLPPADGTLADATSTYNDFVDSAQTMIRYYILPIVTIQEYGANTRVPKYVYELPINWGMMDYGLIDAALVGAEVTQAQHEQLVANPDVEAAPENLDQNISDIAIPQVQAIMEQLRIPADWIDNTYTYREILRMIAGLFQFSQRYWGMHHEVLIDNKAQLDLRWNQISQDRQDRIKATADNLGYNYSDIEPTWLIRRILKHLGDQWGEKSFYVIEGDIL